MKVDVEDISAIEKKVKVEIDAEQVHDEFELAFHEVSKEAKIKGFRQGKAPRKILELHFSDYIKERVLKKLVEETLAPALDRKQLKPIIEPAVDFGELKTGQPFTYTLDVELKPAVEPKDYKGIELEREIYEVTEKSVEHELEDLRERYATYEEPKEPRPAKDSDLLVIDLKAELEGKPVPSGGGENIQYTVGSEVYIPGFAKELTGMKVGEQRSFKVKYPQDHPRKEFAGKEVGYSAAVKSMKEKKLPELNDDFAKEFGGHEHMADLKKKVGEDLETYLKRLSRVKTERTLLEKLVKLNPLEVPKGVVKRHSHELADQSLRRMGVKEPGQQDIERFAAQFTERSGTEVKAGFILEAIIQKEDIKLNPEDEEAKLKELAGTYQVDPSKLKDQLGEESLKHFRAQWLEDKALDFLLAQSKITDKRVNAEDIHSHHHEGHEEQEEHEEEGKE